MSTDHPRIATGIVFSDDITYLANDDEVRSWITYATDRITATQYGPDPLHSITHTEWGITAEVRDGRPYAYGNLEHN